MSGERYFTDDYVRGWATLVLVLATLSFMLWYIVKDLEAKRNSDRERVLVSVFGRGDRIKKKL